MGAIRLADHTSGDYTDIRHVESWDLFSLETLRRRFGPLFDLRIPRTSLLEVVSDN